MRAFIFRHNHNLISFHSKWYQGWSAYLRQAKFHTQIRRRVKTQFDISGSFRELVQPTVREFGTDVSGVGTSDSLWVRYRRLSDISGVRFFNTFNKEKCVVQKIYWGFWGGGWNGRGGLRYVYLTNLSVFQNEHLIQNFFPAHFINSFINC